MDTNKSIYKAIDILKFLAAICVVAIHTNAFKDINNGIYNFLSYCIFTFAVPFFFIISGFFLGKKVKKINCLDASGYRTILISYFKRLAYPYIIWGIWYFFISTAILIISDGFTVSHAAVHQIHIWLVSSPGGGLWYVQAILLLLMMLCLSGKTRYIPYFVVVFLLLSCIPDFVMLFKDCGIIRSIVDFYNKIFITDLNFVWWGIYFLLGLLLGHLKYEPIIILTLKKYKFPILVLFYSMHISIFIIWGDGLLLHVSKIIVSVLLFIFAISTRFNVDENKSIFLRKMSTIIYFTHFSFIYAVQVMLKLLNIDTSSFATLVWIIVSICVITYSYLIVYIKNNPLIYLYEKR